MSYYVTLGGIYISGVTDVAMTSGRDLTAYDGLGNGNFSVPDSENLREWTISCELSEVNTRNLPHWQGASYVFSSFETMLKTKDYSRFLVTSGSKNISELVYIKQYQQKEKYDGVYDVEIVVQEYKPVSVKTTDVPYIARPGKIPVAPKAVAGSTAYSSAKKYTGTAPSAVKAADFKKIDYADMKTGKPASNPCTLPATVKMGITTVPLGSMPVDQSKVVDTSYKGPTVIGTLTDSIVGNFNVIKKGISDYLKKWW
jgi:hypothetical protein